MCGIFGILTNQKFNQSPALLKKTLFHLANSSESRGKDSSGIAITDNLSNVIKVNSSCSIINFYHQKKNMT